MSQRVTQNTTDLVQVILTKDNAAVTGLTFSDVSAQYRKEGGLFNSKVLTALNFDEVGLGVYEIEFVASELDTQGNFTVVVTGVDIDQSTTIVEVVSATQAPTTASLETCVMSGHVFDANGRPVAGAVVTALVIGMPSIEQSVAAVINSEVSALTGANGEFFITLVRLADVEFTIPLANYRRRLVVPNAASALLFEVP